MRFPRILDLVRPFYPIVPQVSPPDRDVSLNEKLRWTGAALLIFLVCSQLPLYGVMSSADPLYWTRLILAYKRGTVMELGVTPILFSKMVTRTLLSASLIDVDITLKEDQALFNAAEKIIAFVVAFGQATVYVRSGIYGYPENLGTGVCLLIIFQLVGASLIVIFLDELFQKGYGFGSALELFITTNICETIFWHAFSPIMFNVVRIRGSESEGVIVPEFEGAIAALFHFLYIWPDKRRALREALSRDGLPNIVSLISTVITLAVVIYLQGCRIEIPVKSKKFRGQRGTFPIWLFYTSNMPTMLQSALTSNFFIFSRMLSTRYPNNQLIKILGVWEPFEGSLQLRAIGGIAYYMSTPHTIEEAILDPIHTAVYAIFMVSACAVLSRIWIELGGSGPRDVAKHFEDQHLLIVGHHKGSMYKELKRTIQPAATFGGGILGLLSTVANFSGVIGGGSGIIYATAIICSYYREITVHLNR